MSRLATAVAALIIVAAIPPLGAAPKGRKMVFMFFVAGKGRGHYEQAELAKMQADHIGNMKKRHAEGFLKLAGPCADPDQQKRGIVLLDIKDIAQVGKHFVEDPYVEHGLLTIDAMLVEAPILQLGKPEATGIAQHTIALFEAPPGKESARAVVDHYARMAKADRPSVAVVMTEPGKLRMALIFREPDVDKVKAWVQTDPAVVRGDLNASSWKQWLGKGALAGPK